VLSQILLSCWSDELIAGMLPAEVSRRQRNGSLPWQAHSKGVQRLVNDAERKTKCSCREVRPSRCLTEGATRRLKAMQANARLMAPKARVSPAGHGETHPAAVASGRPLFSRPRRFVADPFAVICTNLSRRAPPSLHFSSHGMYRQ
jgi:hypothetical protein